VSGSKRESSTDRVPGRRAPGCPGRGRKQSYDKGADSGWIRVLGLRGEKGEVLGHNVNQGSGVGAAPAESEWSAG